MQFTAPRARATSTSHSSLSTSEILTRIAAMYDDHDVAPEPSRDTDPSSR